VSREALNRGAYVLAIPCTTARLVERRALRNCVSLTHGEGGVTKDCVAQAELCTSVLREELGGAPMGRLSPERWRDVVRAMGYVFLAACEPE
jgi:mRNA-degrading endonuclease toxin of MazEF toxin-antitoxin module